MASIDQIHACSSACPVTAFRGGGDCGRRSAACRRRHSALSYNAGSTAERLRRACESHRQHCRFSGPMAAVVRAAANKQKKKAKEKKKSAGDKQWKFDELMLVWDDVFVKACENGSVATALHELSQNGFAQYGRGCVLMEENVLTRPWGAASGFTFKSRYSSSASPELPSYSSTQWSAEYLPKEFILDPSKAPSSSDTPDSSKMEDRVVRVVDGAKLFSVLRGMDKTRLLGLLADSQDTADAAARDAGGEQPYDPAKDELVIMLVVSVDGQPAVGADVLKAFPTVEDGTNGKAGILWTLKLRDDLPY